jgi:hypothetical protein
MPVPKRGDEGAYLFVFEGFVDAGFFHIQDFAAQG